MELGDIVIDIWNEEARKNNCLVYIGESTTTRGKMYNFIAHDGLKVRYSMNDAVLLKVIGRIDEFDDVMDALKDIKDDE